MPIPADMPLPDPTPRTSPDQGCRRTLVAFVVLALVVTMGVGGGWYWRQQRLADAQIEHAQAVFEPALTKLSAPAEAGAPVDLDLTIRVIHGLDKALEEKSSFEEYTQALARQDFRGVAPEVMVARKDLLDVLRKLYATQTDLDDQKELWELTEELFLGTLSVVQVQGDANLVAPSGSFSVDRAQARRLYDDLKAQQDERKRLLEDERALEEQLFESLVDYAEVYYRYVEAWDELSVLRDRAYLAVYNEDWNAALAASELAMAKAPQEREAHLLAALALIEAGQPENDTRIEGMLATYIDDHPDRSAPALLLLGVHHAKAGRTKEAQLFLQQSAAYYPKQSTLLADMLDPYKMRSFLKRSREGSLILDQYTATMLGAGYWSPDLQLARILFEQGDSEAGRKKVLDHFARRRAQGEWDLVIQDIAFCHELLGPHFWEIFPEDSYLDLEVGPNFMMDGVALSVRNRSPKTLHNATLILCLQLTDMFPGTYVALPAEKTVPAVLAHDTTDFGSLKLSGGPLGKDKGVNDVVHHRAVVVADEAVSWVDTEGYKIAEAEEFRQKARLEQVTAGPSVTVQTDFQKTIDRVLEAIPKAKGIEIESNLGADDVVVRLPREVAILRPLFRMKTAEGDEAPSENVIEGDEVVLRFSGLGNFAEGSSPSFTLLMATPFGDVVLEGAPGAPIRSRMLGR